MNKKILLLFLISLYSIIPYANNPQKNIPLFPEEGINFIIANDLGRNGYYQQKNIAQIMGEVAESSDIKFVAAAGDVHHFNGVSSVYDPLWMTNYELIYDHPDLMIDWYAVLGNHEYRGNTQAVVDYTNISRRWNVPSKYYTQTFTTKKGTTCLLVFIDTTPLIEKYRKSKANYPDASMEDESQQLQWIDSVLSSSNDTWKIVIGHHPVYAETSKSIDEREDLQKKLEPILERHKVDIYFCGHIHNFQHIRPAHANIEYVVNSSASLARPVKPIEGGLFCSPDAGFTVCNVNSEKIEFYFINHLGEIIYNYPVVLPTE